VVIRTPDRRLRVFVSSTVGEAGELAAKRHAVVRAISALRLTPVLFEAGARPYPPRELYRAYLAQSDIFIGLWLCWQRYGRVGPGMAVSSLEEELKQSAGMPRLLYVKTPAPEREPRLAAFAVEAVALGGPVSLVDDAGRIASELVASTTRHTDAPVELTVDVGDDMVRIEVRDDDASLPGSGRVVSFELREASADV
jgi:Domain of unknown function (DUF4062)